MKELIKVNYNSNRPTVSGRELHEALKIGTPYDKWFPRMCEYGFVEGIDFSTFLSESTGGRPATNHQLTIDMAKQLCMIQRTELGQMFRKYFIKIEEKWNSPEAVMARALQLANEKLILLEKENLRLSDKVAIQGQQILEMRPKVSYYDVVLNCKELLSITQIAKDYGKSAKWLNRFLHEKGIQFKQSDMWILYQKYAKQGYTSSKTHTFAGSDGNTHSRTHTYWTQKGRLFIYDLMKQNGIYPLIEQEADYE
ncbi:UNVERIFIED_CONTAM: phage antirepressor KilAC domain-containing protein [Streptococcus canis]